MTDFCTFDSLLMFLVSVMETPSMLYVLILGVLFGGTGIFALMSSDYFQKRRADMLISAISNRSLTARKNINQKKDT